MMQRDLPLDGGWDCGPLFAPLYCRPPVVAKRESGGKVVWRKYKRAKPIWTTWKDCGWFWEESERLTKLTGIQHSVDHIVPLLHPIVCGLHCPANMRVIPMAENAAKSNSWWPDMPLEQLKLLDEKPIFA